LGRATQSTKKRLCKPTESVLESTTKRTKRRYPIVKEKRNPVDKGLTQVGKDHNSFVERGQIIMQEKKERAISADYRGGRSEGRGGSSSRKAAGNFVVRGG